MISITRSFEWDMGHRVTNHDSLCKNPHGHRYKLEVEVGGPLIAATNDAQQGMVLDFGRLKRLINERLVDKLDHSFMYWAKDKPMATFAANNPGLRLLSVPFVPTAECIVEYVSTELQRALAASFPDIRLQTVTIYETPTCKAVWRQET